MRIFLVSLCLFLLVSFAAFSHSWYPAECCSDQDCNPVAVKDVKITPNGYEVYGITIPFNEAKKSPDDQFHICRYLSDDTKIILDYNRKPCFWAPPTST